METDSSKSGDHLDPNTVERLSAPEPSPQPGSLEIPDHRLLRSIGRGSYGEVWLARNIMGEYRAVKVIWRRNFTDQRPFEREVSGIRKFEPISRSHDGFVDVLHVGINEERGYLYYIMELGDDQCSGQQIDPERYSPKTLSQEIQLRNRLEAQDCLKLGLALSEALSELHKQGLVHRDVKPSNIIFVKGVPKLADIGLVAAIKENRSYVGTEGFIPPRDGPGSPQADVYGLGKVLYEACTGMDRNDFPELPADFGLSPDAKRLSELNEIILKACKEEIRERYQSALSLHEDLQVLTAGKSIKRLRVLERRFSRLKRAGVISAVTLTILAIAGYVGNRELRISAELRQRDVGRNLAYGNRAMDSGDNLGALSYFTEALRLEEGKGDEERAHRMRIGCLLAQCPKIVQMWAFTNEVESVSFSPDGKRVLAVELGGRARVFDVDSGALLSPPFGQDWMWHGAWSPDGKLVATASEDRTVQLWNADNGSKVATLPHPNKVLSVTFDATGDHLVSGCDDGIARVWNLRAQATSFPLQGHTDAVLCAAFGDNGRLIATASRDNTAIIWDANNHRQLGRLPKHSKWVSWVAFSPDGQFLATACLDHKARIFEVNEIRGTRRRILPDLEHEDGVNCIEFSPDGRLIVTACLDRTVRLWRGDNHHALNPNPILPHSDRVICAAFDPDARRLVTACIDGTVRVWDLAGAQVAPMGENKVFSRDGSRCVNVSSQGLQVLDVVSNQAVSPVIRPDFTAHWAKLSYDGKYVVAGPSVIGTNAPRRDFQVWESDTGKRLGGVISPKSPQTSAALSRDGRRLITYGGKEAQAWDVLAGTALSSPWVHKAEVKYVSFNPDGDVAGIPSGFDVFVWNVTTGSLRFAPLHHAVPVEYAEFSPDGARLVTCAANRGFTKCYAQVWDASRGKPLGPPLRHQDGVIYASFSRDGTRVVTAGEDFAAYVWEAATGRQLTPALKHGETVITAVFSPDGKWVVTASADNTARIWSVKTGDPLSPPFHHLAPLVSAIPTADGSGIITRDAAGATRLRKVEIETRPVQELARLAAFLSGASQPQSQSVAVTWRELSARYPENFKTSFDAIAAWHECVAEECEQDGDWSAAAFHLERLQKIHPEDASVAERLQRAKAHQEGKD